MVAKAIKIYAKYLSGDLKIQAESSFQETNCKLKEMIHSIRCGTWASKQFSRVTISTPDNKATYQSRFQHPMRMLKQDHIPTPVYNISH